MLPKTSPDETRTNVSPAPAQEQPTETNQPGYVTVEQLNEAVGKLQKNIDQVFRGNQSQQDRFTAKMQKKLDAIENAAKSIGLQLTEAQKKSIQENAFVQTISEEASSPPSNGGSPGQAAPEGSADSELADRVNKAAEALQAIWGVTLQEGDPETEIINAAADGEPEEYLEAVKKAIQAKLARTKGTSQSAPPPAAPVAPKSPGVTRGTPQSNPIANITDPQELYRLSKF